MSDATDTSDTLDTGYVVVTDDYINSLLPASDDVTYLQPVDGTSFTGEQLAVLWRAADCKSRVSLSSTAKVLYYIVSTYRDDGLYPQYFTITYDGQCDPATYRCNGTSCNYTMVKDTGTSVTKYQGYDEQTHSGERNYYIYNVQLNETDSFIHIQVGAGFSGEFDVPGTASYALSLFKDSEGNHAYLACTVVGPQTAQVSNSFVDTDYGFDQIRYRSATFTDVACTEVQDVTCYVFPDGYSTGTGYPQEVQSTIDKIDKITCPVLELTDAEVISLFKASSYVTAAQQKITQVEVYNYWSDGYTTGQNKYTNNGETLTATRTFDGTDWTTQEVQSDDIWAWYLKDGEWQLNSKNLMENVTLNGATADFDARQLSMTLRSDIAGTVTVEQPANLSLETTLRSVCDSDACLITTATLFTGSDSFTYAPAIPTQGTYDIYHIVFRDAQIGETRDLLKYALTSDSSLISDDMLELVNKVRRYYHVDQIVRNQQSDVSDTSDTDGSSGNQYWVIPKLAEYVTQIQ